MRKEFLLAMLVLSFLGVAFSAQYTPTVTPSTTDGGHHDKVFNFTIVNNNATVNISQVNITIPAGFTYLGVNGTNVTGTFRNTSDGKILIWENTTHGLIDRNSQANFWFNASYVGVNSNTNRSFNVSIQDNNSGVTINTTNITVNITQVYWSTAPGQFYLKPTIIKINWTNNFSTNFTLTTNNTMTGNFMANVSNGTTKIAENYTQGNSGTACSSAMILLSINATGSYNTSSGTLSPGSAENLTLQQTPACLPGRYYGNVTVINSSNTSVNASVEVIVDVPISTANTVNGSTGIGTFKGVIPANASTYQAFFFNTSNITNTSNVLVNFSWSGTSDVDIFLLDGSGNLKAKSIAYSGSEELVVSNIPGGEVWEIRIYGNSSSTISYTSSGGIVFSTLNVTNSSNAAADVNYGNHNTSQNTSFAIRLQNLFTNNYSEVAETKELFLFKEFGGSQSSNFSFASANSTVFSKLKVSINWTGGTNYTLKLYNPSGSLVTSASAKSNISNASVVESEEFVETTSLANGIWRVEITNHTNASNYNVTVRMYVTNVSEWLRSNYTTSNFSEVNTENGSRDVQLNVTVPRHALDGLYKGTITYKASSGATSKIPVNVNVTAADLLVNETFGVSTVQIKENSGFERAYNVRNVNVSINNTGTNTLIIDSNSSSMQLNKTSGNTSRFIDFNYSFPSTLAPGATGTVTINFTINTANTGNESGTYRGWIAFNSSNATPFRGFNLTVEVVLTSDVLVHVKHTKDNAASTDCSSGDNTVDNSSKDNNVTICALVFWQNDSTNDVTFIPNAANFTTSFVHANDSSYTISASNIYNATNPLYFTTDSTGAKYKINATVASGKPGGPYYASLSTSFSHRGLSYSGTGSNTSVIFYINNTAIKINASTSSITMNEGATAYFNVTAVNYGLPTTVKNLLGTSSNTGAANIDEYRVYKDGGAEGSDTCGSVLGGDGTGSRLRLDPNGTEKCHYEFKVTAIANVTGDKTTTITIYPEEAHFSNVTVSVTVKDTDSSGGTTSPGGGGGDSNSTTTVRNLSVNVTPTTVSIIQGGTGSVTVNIRNNGNQTENNLKLNITGIAPSWFTVDPASHATILKSAEKSFTATLKPPANATVSEYTVTVKAKTDGTEKDTTFKLKVLPTEETKSEINKSYQNASDVVKALESEIASLKSQGYNTTTLESDLAALKTKVSDAGGNISNGDYVNANQLLAEASSLVQKIKDGIKNASKTEGKSLFGGSTLLYAGVAVGVLVVLGVVGYMMLPPSSKPSFSPSTPKPEPRYEYKPPKKPLIERIKELLQRK